MDGLLTEIKTIKKVQSNIDKFESLSLDETRISRSSSTKSKRSVAELLPLESRQVDRSKSNSPPSPISHASKKHKRHESTAFLQKSYLQQPTLSNLPDDALEILRNQPDREDLMAVLQYLEHGIKRKHDFNIHVLGPKASQILNVLVTETIPDQWHVLRQQHLPADVLLLKRLLILMFRSVAGVGALLMQIKILAAKLHSQLRLEDALSILASVLYGSQFLGLLLQTGIDLYPKESQLRIFWQEAVALLCGSRVLSTVSQAVTTASGLDVKEAGWLSIGGEYAGWLARNISYCASNLDSDRVESWLLLSQALKRALSLGYKGIYLCKGRSALIMSR
jgi:hypothetical protein